ncbi:GGDEF domain-containing protein [Qipengyuania sp. XHP0207]|uniref:GGDEF domain-containing protein n=1 Tax=Qipengyuania sp. XHP0207 TaxID=3038078 RepID=UPI00241CFEFE|nr:GGDEF domain-containing protein [Qipengyuania sp. XHP0207]MDG5747226.1 GGDEF domain-containing protein [Qipengyuania sp. XHP0207]
MDGDGLRAGAKRPADRDRTFEVRREAVLSMLERERHALVASLLALAVMAVSVNALGNPGMLGLFLAFRIVSFVFTRWAATRLERRMRSRSPIGNAEYVLFFAMMTTGATLALMLWPAPPGAGVAASSTIQLVVLIAVTLIAVTMAAFPMARDGMLGAFWLVSCSVVTYHPERLDDVFLLISTIFTLGVRVYASNTGRHIVHAAKTTVENAHLTSDLAEALAKAEFLSWRDPLTGLYNRRRLFEETDWHRPANSLHLLTIDLDRFKAINDRHGHAAGDRVLVATAQKIRSVLEEHSWRLDHLAFRLGGEEFLITLQGLDLAEAESVSECLRRAIETIGEELPEYESLQVSASIGLAEWRPGESLDTALQRSDVACYQAKDAGRNRVRCAA